MAVENHIYAGSKKVVLSGSVLTDQDLITIDIDPNDKDDMMLKLSFKFVIDEKKPKRMNIVGEGSEGTITLQNLQDKPGVSPESPLKIASNKTSMIYLLFKVVWSGSNKLINYTFYVEPIAKVKSNAAKKEK